MRPGSGRRWAGPGPRLARTISALRSTGSGVGEASVGGWEGGHSRRTVGMGGGMGSNSLNRRTRLPRRMHWSSASPSPSSRSVVIIAAPWRESCSSWSRTRTPGQASDHRVGLDRLVDLGAGLGPSEYMELDPSVRFSVTQLAHTRTEATEAAMDTGA